MEASAEQSFALGFSKVITLSKTQPGSGNNILFFQHLIVTSFALYSHSVTIGFKLVARSVLKLIIRYQVADLVPGISCTKRLNKVK